MRSPAVYLKKYPRHLARTMAYIYARRNNVPVTVSYPICRIGNRLKPIHARKLRLREEKDGIDPVQIYTDSIRSCTSSGGKLEGVVLVSLKQDSGAKLPYFFSEIVLHDYNRNKFDCFVNPYGVGYCIRYNGNLTPKTYSFLKNLSKYYKDMIKAQQAYEKASGEREREATFDIFNMAWNKYQNAIKDASKKAYLSDIGKVFQFSVFRKTEEWPKGGHFPGRAIPPVGKPIYTGYYPKGKRVE